MKKTTAVNFLLLVSLAASLVSTGEVAGQTYCPFPYPWCDQTPKLYKFIAPDDPSLYLGSLISSEKPSDWMHYSPIMAQVQELTAGLSADKDKVFAIADWLKHSKVPRMHIYTSLPASIIEIWSFPDGECEEASFLLTAMLRLAGIPAMRFSSWNEEHVATRAWVDGNWIVADATPTESDSNSSSARIYGPDDPSFIPGFQERPLWTLSGVAVPGTENEKVDSFTLFSYEPILSKGAMQSIGLAYGGVAYPVTNAVLHYDEATGTILENGTPDQALVIQSVINAEDDRCLDRKSSWYSSPLDLIDPWLGWMTVDATLGSWQSDLFSVGYVETVLPTCGVWKIQYYWNNMGLNADGSQFALAFAEFRLDSESDFVIIRPSSLQPADGADLYSFNKLVETLNKLPSYEELGGKGVQEKLQPRLTRRHLKSPGY